MSVFSKTCEYAIRAVFYIAQSSHEGRKVGIKEIAKKIKCPEPFLGKILQNLSRVGVIQSLKGPNGGFFINSDGLKKPIADIVLAVDGEHIFVGCGMGLEYCSEKNPCPLHNRFKKIRNNLSNMLKNTSIGQFNLDLIKGRVTLYK